jgi:prefoldin alpha subunit
MKEDFQNKVVQFQVLESNLKALQEKADEISQRVDELQITRTAIEELKDLKPTNALIPLGSGNFVSGRIENTEEVLVGIGGGIAIKKKREDAITVLDDTLKELEKTLEDIKNQIMDTALKLEKLQEELEKLQK